MKNLIVSISIIIMTISCSGQKKEKADLVIINGKVLTIDRDNPFAEAVAVKDEMIVAVGTTRKISGMIAKGISGLVSAKGCRRIGVTPRILQKQRRLP